VPTTIAACLIVGDCIATRPHGLGARFSKCDVAAKVGLSSGKIVPLVPDGTALKWLVLSAGSNNPLDPRLEADLLAMRVRARNAHRVIWVLPIHPAAAKAVRSVAEKYGDAVVSFTPGRDRVHPKSYGALARDVAVEVPR
jgi:hypothetical protein